jgi:hypothetical protein
MVTLIRLADCMKIYFILCLTLALAGCASSPEKASLTESQAIALAAPELPPLGTNSAYTATFADGYWEIYVMPAAEKAGVVDFSLATNVWRSVAIVRDTDSKVEVNR